ncbi:MAG: NADPH-dependent FMN reductase [Halobacteriovoraceae bacterium]|nr:NADPH-dependent FMN reductase [Halobacteriovoraceae bacterium]|tara:strand:- start:134 stop:643 length:510 start_codon:yes stop_codon:yes gene_type:complete
MSDVVILAGSNNKNLELANEFEKHFTAKSVKSTVLDLVSLNLPLYTPTEEVRGIPKAVLQYKELMDNAKGFVFVVPEYNGGVPPVVTNFIAWISRSGDQDWRSTFNAKPAGIASFSGSGGVQALVSLRTQLSYIGLNVIGRQVRATFKEGLNSADLEGVGDLLIEGIRL